MNLNYSRILRFGKIVVLVNKKCVALHSTELTSNLLTKVESAVHNYYAKFVREAKIRKRIDKNGAKAFPRTIKIVQCLSGAQPQHLNNNTIALSSSLIRRTQHSRRCSRQKIEAFIETHV